MYSLTIFNNIFDNKTHKRMDFKSWDSMESMLYKLSELPGYKQRRGEAIPKGVKASPLISPAVYQDGTTRANKNVIEWAGWAAIDVDEHKFEGNLENELRSRYGDWYYVCYSTASSTVDHPKFRLVFPTRSPVQSSKIRHFWFALNTELESIGDRQTKDFSRMYYIPAKYPAANNFIFTNHGSFIDPDELMNKHEFVDNSAKSLLDKLPEDLQRKFIQKKKAGLNNTSIRWSSYKDCPFINRNLLAEYSTISETGWYHKLYQILVSISMNAVKKGYPITAYELEQLCREIDRDNGNWYESRPIRIEAQRAIEYALKNS